MANYHNYFRPTLRLRVYTPGEFNGGVIASDNITCNDVVVVPGAFEGDTYRALASELYRCNEKYNDRVLVSWHKNHHLVANDKFMRGAWKDECPLFRSIVDGMCSAFNVIPNATRVNIYCRNGDGCAPDSKPFHFDRAAFTPGLTQNITIAASFGATREICFRFAKYKREPSAKWTNVPKGMAPLNISTLCRNGSVYAFTRDVNCEFQHGVIPESPHVCGGGEGMDRISIVVWGTRFNLDISDSRVSARHIPTPSELGVRAIYKH